MHSYLARLLAYGCLEKLHLVGACRLHTVGVARGCSHCYFASLSPTFRCNLCATSPKVAQSSFNIKAYFSMWWTSSCSRSRRIFHPFCTAHVSRIVRDECCEVTSRQCVASRSLIKRLQLCQDVREYDHLSYHVWQDMLRFLSKASSRG